jgi:hypothetical protein
VWKYWTWGLAKYLDWAGGDVVGDNKPQA